jgi:hypothetical protein
MTSGHERIDTGALRALAGRFDREIGKPLDDAGKALASDATSIEYSNFTAVAHALAVVYVEACNFAVEDLSSKRHNAADFGRMLVATADAWDKADHASTVKPTG